MGLPRAGFEPALSGCPTRISTYLTATFINPVAEEGRQSNEGQKHEKENTRKMDFIFSNEILIHEVSLFIRGIGLLPFFNNVYLNNKGENPLYDH